MREYHVEYRIEVEADSPEDAVSQVAMILAGGGALVGNYHVMEYDGTQVPLRPGEVEIDLSPGDERECSRCGDEVQILNSQDECMACEEARAHGDVCSRCDEDVDWDPALGAYREDGVTVCGSCAHNERRSS